MPTDEEIKKAEIIDDLLKLFDKELTLGAMGLYVRAIKTIPVDQLPDCIDRSLQKTDYMPKPLHLLEAHEEILEEYRTTKEYFEVVDKVRAYLKKHHGFDHLFQTAQEKWIEEARDALGISSHIKREDV